MSEGGNGYSYISREELYCILEDIPVPVILIETDRTIRFANKQALQLGGYKNLIGRKCYDTFCKDDACNCTANGSDITRLEKQKYFKIDGETVSVFKKTHPVHFKDQFFYALFFTDLSEQEKREEDLNKTIEEKIKAEQKGRVESKKFELLFESVNDALYLFDKLGKIVKVNQHACDRLGYSRQELESMGLADITSPKSGLEIPEKIRKILKKKEHFFESDDLCRDGTKIPVEVSARLIEFEGRELILSSARDITLRKEYEKQLLEAKQITEYNEAELKTIFNKVPSVIFIFDEHRHVQRVNQKGIQEFNIKIGEIKNKRIGDVLSCVNSNTHSNGCGFSENCLKCHLLKIIDDTIQQGKETSKREINLTIRKKGLITQKTVLVSTAVLKNNGNPLYILTIDDITERKKMEKELILAKEKAEVSEKLKTAFLNNISHEIRTPLNGLLGFLDFFEDDYDQFSKEERKNLIEIMRKSGDRLINTVTDIIEASKLDSGIIDFTKDNFSLKMAMTTLTEDIKKKYAKPSVEFSLKMDSGLETQQIETDKSKLIRILRNLLDNAFKFTQEGTVKLDISKQNNELIFLIEDTGIGIAKKDLAVIFDPFRQVDINLSRAFDGSGLGLTIALKLVSYLGGKLSVESEIDKGSRFWFSIPHIFNSAPVKEAPAPAPDIKEELDLEGKAILIAEDDEVNYLFLEAVLIKKGCRLIHAENGKEAVDLFERNRDVDLIIMDLKMPIMNGIEATFSIREIDQTVPVIAHSAFVLNNEREQSLAAGCADYLPKPVKTAELIDTIKKHIKKKQFN